MTTITIEGIARVCHEANRGLQRAWPSAGIAPAPPWEACGEEMRDSAIAGVQGVLDGRTPEESHEGWLAFKREHGWVYGPVKSATDKTHPCMVPYDDLPPQDRIKDHLFNAVVNTLAPWLT